MRPAVLLATAISMLAVALWLGGLTALGAIVAPTVFASVSFPQSADAMTLVFRRFDVVAMTCGGVALASEAFRLLAGAPFGWSDRARAGATVVAAALASYQGSSLTPRIAALHASGVVRGSGPGGLELSRLHDLAEASGKAQVALLFAVVVLHAVSLGQGRRGARRVP